MENTVELNREVFCEENFVGENNILNYVQAALLKQDLKGFSYLSIDDLVGEISFNIMQRNAKAILKQKGLNNENWKKMKICYVSDANVKQAYIDIRRYHERKKRRDDHVVSESDYMPGMDIGYCDDKSSDDVSEYIEKFENILDQYNITDEEFDTISSCMSSKSANVKNSIICKLVRGISNNLMF